MAEVAHPTPGELLAARLDIRFEGERVSGVLTNERGGASPFEGWLDLLSALRGLCREPGNHQPSSGGERR